MRIVAGSPQVTRHAGKVKGGQFKASADIHAPGAEVRMPFLGKIAHVAKNKTQCVPGVKHPPGSQFTLRAEVMVGNDRHLVKPLQAVSLARLEPVAGLSSPPLRHVPEGTVIGHVVDFVHVAANNEEVLASVLPS